MKRTLTLRNAKTKGGERRTLGDSFGKTILKAVESLLRPTDLSEESRVGVVGGRFWFCDEFRSILFDRRELLLYVVEGTIGVTVDSFERKTLLKRFEAVENVCCELCSSFVQSVGVRVGSYVGMSSFESVFDDGITVSLKRTGWGKKEVSESGLRLITPPTQVAIQR